MSALSALAPQLCRAPGTAARRAAVCRAQQRRRRGRQPAPSPAAAQEQPPPLPRPPPPPPLPGQAAQAQAPSLSDCQTRAEAASCLAHWAAHGGLRPSRLVVATGLLATLPGEWTPEARWALAWVRARIAGGLQGLDEQLWAALAKAVSVLLLSAPADQWARPAAAQVGDMVSVGQAGSLDALAPGDAVSAAAALATAGLLSPSAARVIAATVGGGCSAQQLPSLAWALAAARVPYELGEVLRRTPQEGLSSIEPRGLCTVLWAMAHAQCVMHGVLPAAALEAAAAPQFISELRPAELTPLLVGAARGAFPEAAAQRLWQVVLQHGEGLLRRQKPVELSRAIWAAATMRVHEAAPLLADCCAALCGTMADSGGDAAVSAAGWGLAQLGGPGTGRALRGLAAAALRNRNFTAAGGGPLPALRFLEALQGAPEAAPEARRLCAALAAPLAAELAAGGAQAAAAAVVLYARLGVPAAPVFASAGAVAAAGGEDFRELPPRAAAGMLWAFAAAAMRIDLDAGIELFYKAAAPDSSPYCSLGADGAAATIWAAAELGLAPHQPYLVGDLARRMGAAPDAVDGSSAAYALQSLQGCGVEAPAAYEALGASLDRRSRRGPGAAWLPDPIPPGALSQLVSAFADSHQACPWLFDALRVRLSDHGVQSSLPLEDIVAILGAFAKFQQPLPKEALLRCAARALTLLQKTYRRDPSAPRHIAWLVWATSTLATTPACHRLMGTAGQLAAAAGLIAKMSLGELSAFLWGAAVCIKAADGAWGRPWLGVLAAACKVAAQHPQLPDPAQTDHVCGLLLCYTIAAQRIAGGQLPQQAAGDSPRWSEGIPLLGAVAELCSAAGRPRGPGLGWAAGLSAGGAVHLLLAALMLQPEEGRIFDAVRALVANESWLALSSGHQAATLSWCFASSQHGDDDTLLALFAHCARPAIMADASAQVLACLACSAAAARVAPDWLRDAVHHRLGGDSEPPHFAPHQAASTLGALLSLGWADPRGDDAAARVYAYLHAAADGEEPGAVEVLEIETESEHPPPPPPEATAPREAAAAAAPARLSAGALVPAPLRVVPYGVHPAAQPHLWPFSGSAGLPGAPPSGEVRVECAE